MPSGSRALEALVALMEVSTCKLVISTSSLWSLRSLQTVLRLAFEVVGGCGVNCWLNSFAHLHSSHTSSLLKLTGWLSGPCGCPLSMLMVFHSFLAPFPRLISCRNSLHLAILMVCTALEISQFSLWIWGSPGKITLRRSHLSDRIAASCGKKGYTSWMRPAGIFLAAALTKVLLKRCSPTMISLSSNIAAKAS